MKKVIALVVVTLALVACNNSTTTVETEKTDSLQIDTTLVPAEDSLLIGENVQ